MNETSIPLSHIQIWLSVLGLFISVAIAASGAAWVGVKIALKPITKEIESIKELRKERELRLIALESRIFPTESHNRIVTMEMCETCQSECSKRNAEYFKDIKIIMREQTRSLCDIRESVAWFNGNRDKIDVGCGR